MALLLDNIVFTSREIPDTVEWGGKQQLAVHKLLGGTRVIDAMGPDPRPIEWAGRFYGSAASVRARLVDALKDSGAQVQLIWGSFTYKVVVQEFLPTYKHEWDVSYKIRCEVVTNFTVTTQATIDMLVASDMLAAQLAAKGL